MPSADLIVALGKDGTVTEQGSFVHLSRSGGYVEELLRSHAESSNDSESPASAISTKEELPQKRSTMPAKVPAAKPEDKRRQLGDFTVYRYYFGSIGTPLLAVLILLELLAAFFSTYPSQ